METLEVASSEVKLRGGNFMIPCSMYEQGSRIYLDFKYNLQLKDEIKAMQNARFHGYDEVNPRKIWSVTDSPRNRFQLAYLQGKDPYFRYDQPLDTSIFPKQRFNLSANKLLDLFAHTPEMAAHLYQRRQCVIAGEMGTAKTIAAILALEQVAKEFKEKYGFLPKIFYVAPRSALKAVQREFRIWDSDIRHHIDFMTYEGLTRYVKSHAEDESKIEGFVLILDESSKVKNHTSQRSQAAQIVADRFRACYGDEACIWLMTGSPAPKSPSDWWSQCEIACPGYLKEGDIYKFKNRLAVVIQQTDATGGSYPVLVTWKDSEKKCAKCGKDEMAHTADVSIDHGFVPGKNEVLALYGRLKGLVLVKFKKDCLDLPDKNYRRIELKPNASTLRVASILKKASRTTIEALTKLRELSDGFQYQEVRDGEKECELCVGQGKVIAPNPTTTDTQAPLNLHSGPVPESEVGCPNCGGKGKVPKYKRIVKEVACPKDDVIVDLLDEYEDVGRVVIYAGFSGSIDRCVKTCLKQKWAVIRVDQGRDVIYDADGNIIKGDYLNVFQDELEKYPRVAFVAHPGSAGMGLTLTASPMITYFSNDFNAESRIQSEDRIHRPGMDVNRGATIIDIIHLPSDVQVLENLQKKRDLQSMTLGEIQLEMDETVEREL